MSRLWDSKEELIPELEIVEVDRYLRMPFNRTFNCSYNGRIDRGIGWLKPIPIPLSISKTHKLLFCAITYFYLHILLICRGSLHSFQTHYHTIQRF